MTQTTLKKLMDGMRASARFKLELRRSVTAFKSMSLKEPFETLIPATVDYYKAKINLHDEIVKISTTFLDGTPKRGVDYSKLLARMPEITAEMEYIDESIFQMMPLVFALLIDQKPDSEGHISHLNITKDQRQTLIDSIDAYFGDSLDKKDRNWTVSSASLSRVTRKKITNVRMSGNKG